MPSDGAQKAARAIHEHTFRAMVEQGVALVHDGCAQKIAELADLIRSLAVEPAVQAERERAERAEEGLAWFAECVIREKGGTPDKEGWIRRAFEMADARRSEREAEREKARELVEAATELFRVYMTLWGSSNVLIPAAVRLRAALAKWEAK